MPDPRKGIGLWRRRLCLSPYNMRLSLCVIAGNAEHYVSRFLDSFQPHVDEVCFVRAIGNQTPDRTLEIARERGCITAEYFNQRPWPHVDDFAAARNVAWGMATGDFVMWADLDDLLERGDHIKKDLAALPAECLALSVPYDIRDDQVRIYRERVIRRGAAKWINPIHECLDFGESVNVGETNNWQIAHVPTGHRKANDERNVRILESIKEPTGSQRFHLVQSLRAVGRIGESVALAGEILTTRPDDLGEPELFELLMGLGQVAEDPAHRTALMLQAVGLDPTRREGYGEMAICEMAAGNPDKAESWLKAMNSLTMPERPAWNMRRKFYGWLAPQLRGMSLRMQGRVEEADTLEVNHFIRHDARISLLHATRGRADMAAATRRKWLERAANPDSIEHIFGLDVSDPESIRLTCHRHLWLRGNGGPVDAWNACAQASVGQILVQLSDDWEPPLHWDRMILEAIGDTSKPAVLAVSDGHRKDDLLCMAICTRERWKQQGYLFHPEFFSMFSDNWFSEQAFADGVVIDARDRITFEHMHPAFGKGEMDETYARSNAGYHYTTGAGILRRLQEGVKVSAEIHGWFDFRDFYDYVAQTMKNGSRFAEVGSWKGKSATYLGHRLMDLGKEFDVCCIDTFQGDADTGAESVEEQFFHNVHQAKFHPSVYIGESAKQAGCFFDASLDGVFLDAAHDYESVKADIAAWLPKVKEGGIFAGHDIDSPGVLQAVQEAGFEFVTMGRVWIKKP